MFRQLKYSFVLLLILNVNCAFIPRISQMDRDSTNENQVYPPYRGLKKRLAVFDFENRSSLSNPKIGSAMSDMLISQLSRSQRFTLVERSQIERIMQEQALGQTGLIAEQSAAQVGQLLGVESIVVGKILEAKQETGSHKFDNKKDKWNLSLKAVVGYAHISYQLISTSTGEILSANDFFAKELKPGFDLETKDYDVKNTFAFDQTVVGAACRKAVYQIAAEIVKNADSVNWSGKVVQVTADSLVYFKPGISSGLTVGQVLNIFAKPEQVNDEGLVSDLPNQLNRPKARIEVTGFIGDKVTRARLLLGEPATIGDLVKTIGKTDTTRPSQN